MKHANDHHSCSNLGGKKKTDLTINGETWHLFLLLELLLWGELNGAAAIHLALGALEGTLTLQHWLTLTFSTSPALKKMSPTVVLQNILAI